MSYRIVNTTRKQNPKTQQEKTGSMVYIGQTGVAPGQQRIITDDLYNQHMAGIVKFHAMGMIQVTPLDQAQTEPFTDLVKAVEEERAASLKRQQELEAAKEAEEKENSENFEAIVSGDDDSPEEDLPFATQANDRTLVGNRKKRHGK